LQRRRAQTEARISILKQCFLGRPMRAKGSDHRKLALAWMRKIKNKPFALREAA
jgi:hypothetical protein